jgi:electron transfer flavoprotein beta subunit
VRIAVCVKQVLDPETIRVSRSRQAIDDRRARKIMNPPDRWALDAALRLKEQDSSTEVFALTIGDRDAEDVLREALALGADRAILLSDPALTQATSAGRAKVVAAALGRLGDVQLVLTGSAALDTGRGQLAPRLAIELGDWPVLMDVENLQIENGYISCLQYVDKCYFQSSHHLPAVVSVRETPEQPRYAHSSAIMNAYRKSSVEVWSSLALGIDLSDLAVPSTNQRLRVPPPREYGVLLEGTPAEAATALLTNLKNRRMF